MGCSAPGGFKLASLFGRRGADSTDGSQRARLEHKLWLAREAPGPGFDLSDLGLRNVPPGVYALCRVLRKEALLLSNNSLRELGGGGRLADLRLIRVLALQHNLLVMLSPELGLLSSLRELHLQHNRLERLPEELAQLTQLRILDVSHNRLKSIPGALGGMQNLQFLSLRGNEALKILPKELCNAKKLKTVDLDSEKFKFPPEDTADGGTEEIMKFLCRESGIEYVPPLETDDASPNSGEPYLFVPSETDLAQKSCIEDWEARDEHLQRLENEVHEAAKRQRQKFLDEFTKEQKKMDDELNKIQQEKDVERSGLIEMIRRDERATEHAVDALLKMGLSNPEHVRKFLERDREEHDRFLEMCRKNYITLKKTDTLKAMEGLLQEECEYEKSFKIYGESQNEATRSLLLREIDIDDHLGAVLKSRELAQSDLVEELLNDENLQKAAVGLLLERCDARCRGLVQEIDLVESHLAKLSIIELDRRKFQLNENLDNLAEQRIKLSALLVDLLERREKRRSQLVDTLHAMELEKKSSSDFWLIQYQQLLDTLPDKIVTSQRRVDPVFANYLLGEGTIHCLPFLIARVSSELDLASLTDGSLKDRGIRLSSDRTGVLKAIKLYLEETNMTKLKIEDPSARAERPSAPSQKDVDAGENLNADNANTEFVNRESECIICMENACEIVFIPCGHLCCCTKCSGSIEKLCPMCRQEIERKIRVMQP